MKEVNTIVDKICTSLDGIEESAKKLRTTAENMEILPKENCIIFWNLNLYNNIKEKWKKKYLFYSFLCLLLTLLFLWKEIYRELNGVARSKRL